ncbi:MAG: hypothetical protein RLZZ336_998 [Cyanobacteriota bacterium]
MEPRCSTPVLNENRNAVKRRRRDLDGTRPEFVLATSLALWANATLACPVPNAKRPQTPLDDDEPLVDPGRSLPLRLLALLGAASFVMLGVASVVVPLMQPAEPPPLPDQRPHPTV